MLFRLDHGFADADWEPALKLPVVGYQQVESVEDAVRLLVESEGDGKILAGGQSLIPMMAYRLLTPSILIDIGRIEALKSIELSSSELKIGALVRWCDILESRSIAATHPLLREAISHVAHYQIRNRGTIGGSLAHCDPAAECPATVLALDGMVDLAGPHGQRSVPARGFFQGLLSTDLGADEIIISVRLPLWASKRRWAFNEFARRQGDFALAGVCLHFEIDDGKFSSSRIVGFGIADSAMSLPTTETALNGLSIGDDLGRVLALAGEEIDPPHDPHAPPEYRRAIFSTLLGRAIEQALSRAE